MTAVSAEVGRVVEEAAPKKTPRAPLVLGALAALALTGFGGYRAATANKESTDDAYVEGRVMSVSARVPGQVARVFVQDNQEVKAGDVLVELDASELDARAQAARADLAAADATLASARAQLALTDKNADATLRQAKGGMTQAASSIRASRSSIDQAQADVVGAESRLRLAQTEYERVVKLHKDGAIAQAELDAKSSELDQARAQTAQAKARLDAMKASLDGSAGGFALAEGRLAAAETAPQQRDAARAAVDLAEARVKQAQAALTLADLNLSYTKIVAPSRGVVSRRTVEIGQMVDPSRPLLAVVPLDDVWVVANFKEDQLEKVHAGQSVKIEVDAYGGKTVHGHVDSLAGASGAKFALLPPDNASGNFIKVVQRIPVLVRIDDAPGVVLRPGMSVEVTVDTK